MHCIQSDTLVEEAPGPSETFHVDSVLPAQHFQSTHPFEGANVVGIGGENLLKFRGGAIEQIDIVGNVVVIPLRTTEGHAAFEGADFGTGGQKCGNGSGI